MSSATESPAEGQYFQLRRYGSDVLVVVPSPDIEGLPSHLLETAAEVVMSPLRQAPATNVLFDLSRVNFFGTEFIQFLLRCHLLVKKHGCELTLCGATRNIREVLRQTALDTLWAIYDTRQESLDALRGD